MARRRARFSKETLNQFLKYSNIGDCLFDSEIKNLEVRKRKSPSPHLSFITQIKIKGELKPTSFKLGSFPEHDIPEIRFKHSEYKKLCLDGINPKDVFERKKQEELRSKALIKQKNISLKTVFNLYLEANNHIQTNTIKDMTNSLNKNCKTLLKKPIINITAMELQNLIERLYVSGKRHTALNLYSYLNTIFNHALGVMIDENNYLLELNPFSKLLNLRKKIKKSLPRRKVIDMNPIIIRKLFDEGNKIQHPQYNGVFKNKEYIFNLIHLSLFTGLRRYEICNLQWKNINLVDKKEEFKYPHMIAYGLKGDQDQFKNYCSVIPLTKYLRAILQNQRKISGKISQWVFPSNNGKDALKGDDSKPMSSPTKNIHKVAYVIGHPFSLHDLRHLFASIALSLGYTEDIIKQLLHHGIGSITQRFLHQITPESYKVYNKIHREMLRIWDVYF